MCHAFYQELYESCIVFLEKPSKLGMSIPIFMNKEIEI